MATINLFEAAKSLQLTSFEFISSYKVSTDAKYDENSVEIEKAGFYLVMELSNPIEKVTGSVTIYDPESPKRIPLVAYDVTEVKVHSRILEKYADSFTDIVMNGTSFSGKYGGDLILDVTKEQDVWLTDKKFSKFGQEKRNEGKQARLNSIREKLKAQAK